MKREERKMKGDVETSISADDGMFSVGLTSPPHPSKNSFQHVFLCVTHTTELTCKQGGCKPTHSGKSSTHSRHLTKVG